MQKKENSFYLPTLDGWRAISIAMVLICHTFWFKYGPGSSSFDDKFWHTFYQFGLYGVSTFFTISGYLITSRILHEYKLYGSFNLKDFYVKRFFRIIPPFYFFLLILMILNFCFNLGTSNWDLFTSMFFIRIYQINSSDWYTAHTWSLCVEEHFYIILSLYFFMWGLKKTKWWLLVSIGIIFLWNIISFRFKEIDIIRQLIAYFKVFSSMDYMFIGGLFAYLSTQFEETRNYLKRYQLILFLLLFCLFFLNFPLKILIIPIFTGLLIYLTTLNPHEWILFILENKILKLIGKISYSLYLWQQLFLVPQNAFNHKLSLLQSFPINIIIIFILGSFSHYFIETPLIKFGRRFIKQNI
jgi:peptidoglycan/LPS O-acetylase OafA/YrhL